MSLEHILLGMLAKPAGGYDLKNNFDQGARHFWSAELSQLYPTLQAMHRKRWLKRTKVPSTQGPPRLVYERTRKGTAVLHQWLTAEPILGTQRFAYIAQLLFLGELGDLEQTRSFLQQLRGKLATSARFLEVASEGVLQTPEQCVQGLNHQAFHDWISLQFGVKSLQAKVAWCDQAIQLVERRLAQETHD